MGDGVGGTDGNAAGHGAYRGLGGEFGGGADLFGDHAVGFEIDPRAPGGQLHHSQGYDGLGLRTQPHGVEGQVDPACRRGSITPGHMVLLT